MHIIKGMVQVAGVTYRIERLSKGRYEVVRILDDVRVGSFETIPSVEVKSTSIAPGLMRDIVRMAVIRGKTSWTGRLDLPENLDVPELGSVQGRAVPSK